MPVMPVPLLVTLPVLLRRPAVLTLPVSMSAPLFVSAMPAFLMPVTRLSVLVASAVSLFAVGRHDADDSRQLQEQRQQRMTGSSAQLLSHLQDGACSEVRSDSLTS
jgi:hypothetical protein